MQKIINPTKFEEYKDHKKVIEFDDIDTGLHGFIAIHNDNLGDAVGGTRMYPYQSKEDALRDVLRLSQAMTYKCALAGVPHGGGKAVVIGDPDKDKTDELIKKYAMEIGDLKGEFYTGEDVGISESNVQLMLTISPYFIGKRGLAGDPSPYASLSVYYAMKEAVKLKKGNDNLSGLTVGIKGVGKVGRGLVELLLKEGINLIVADINNQAIKDIESLDSKIKISTPENIISEQMDIYAPCAMGNEFNESSIKNLKATIICGGANNQLKNKSIGEALHKLNILYVPDYVANSGGLIDVVDELESDGFKKVRVLERIVKVRATVEKILQMSIDQNRPTNEISDILAESIFQKKPDTSIAAI